MSLPYEHATSGRRAMDDLRRALLEFGVVKFGCMEDALNGELTCQFEYHGRSVSIRASAKGYAAAWLRKNPYTYRTRCTRVEHERKALAQGHVSVYSELRDWIKGQIVAIETGMLSFEGAFLGQILLPNGRTVLEEIGERALLPQLEGKTDG